MPTIKLISWHPDIHQKVAALQRRGLLIEAEAPAAISGIVGAMATSAPAAIVLDLDKRPSSARNVAMVLAESQSARRIPILFAGGLPEKVEDIRSWMPNAHFTTWARAPEALRKLLEKPPSETRTTPSHRIYTTPLPKKLGIAANMQVALIAAPDGFEETLGDLPPDTTLATWITPSTGLALCFVRSLDELASTIDMLALRLPKTTHVWIVHPKRTGKYKVDFNQNHVRESGLATGFVDYKVCSVDNDWSALKFSRRKP